MRRIPRSEKNLPCLAMSASCSGINSRFIPHIHVFRMGTKSTREENASREKTYKSVGLQWLMISRMNFDAVLFDAAETLFTTKGSVGDIYHSIAKKYGSSASAPEIHAAFVSQFRNSGPLTT